MNSISSIEDTRPSVPVRLSIEETRPRPAVAPPALVTPPRRPTRPGCVGCIVWSLAGFVGTILGVLSIGAIVLFAFPPDRTNILLLGMDRRPGESDVSRTDTMILTTIFPERGYVGMLSIPRDLYVTMPTGGQNRVNAAHALAEAEAPGAGPAAAVQTVAQNFGVTVTRFARIDFEGFVRIVDAMGGVEIDVPEPLIDTQYPTYDYGTTVVSFDPGPQHMDGERALAYARIRHGSSDLQRAERQQIVIQAIAARLLQPETWSHLPAVYAAARSSVDTNVSLLEWARLAPSLVSTPPSEWDRRVFDRHMLQPHTTPSGAAVQLPVWENINPVLLEVFAE